MAYTFFKAQGYNVGNSLCEVEKTDLALEEMKKAKEKGVKLLLPIDTKIGKNSNQTQKVKQWLDRNSR